MTSQLNLDLSSLQQQVEDNLTCLRQLGRKSALAYLGLWGIIYDNTKALVNDNAAWIDLVEKRGIQLEAALGEKVQQLDIQAAHELKKWREQAKENARMPKIQINAFGKPKRFTNRIGCRQRQHRRRQHRSAK